MDDTQHNRRIVDDSAEVRNEPAENAAGATTQTVARLLANPRRVRRA
jgi:hypothetical protein